MQTPLQDVATTHTALQQVRPCSRADAAPALTKLRPGSNVNNNKEVTMMKTKYLTPELFKEELYAQDVITASGESSTTSSELKRAEVDNAFRAFSILRGN